MKLEQAYAEHRNSDDVVPHGSFHRPLFRLHNVTVGAHRHEKLSLKTSRDRVYVFDQLNGRVFKAITDDTIVILSEFVGTFLFIFTGFVGNSIIDNIAVKEAQFRSGTKTIDPITGIYVALVWCMSVIVNAWAFFEISGGLFSPTVSLAMMIIGAIDPLRGVFIIITQMMASLLAAVVCYGLLPSGSLPATELGEHTTVTQGLFIEMLLTAQVLLAVFTLSKENEEAPFAAPVGVGLAVFGAVLAGQSYTGASLNPARSFAVCVVQGSFPGYHWIYWIGPGLGALLAVLLYLLIRKLEIKDQ